MARVLASMLVRTLVLAVVLPIHALAGMRAISAVRTFHEGLLARSSLVTAALAAELYFVDHHTYRGMTADALRRSYAPSLDPARVVVVSSTRTTYCLESAARRGTLRKPGPVAPLARGACA